MVNHFLVHILILSSFDHSILLGDIHTCR